ncbi:MAG: SDR family NAD(P)-dependent oxidoreductase [Gammaproteobacteria bacterium]|nr:SDR family NAD(P)-dependent oxidoreductase [Gammaproteobacteria bacterium]
MPRTCLITGTTHGIGLVTAQAVARAGYTLVMANRNTQRTHLVEDHLRKTTGNENVSSLSCDLSSLASVRACASEFLARHRSLDLLINNAGMITAKPQFSTDGLELTFATNHLGPFLLTNLLLESLSAAPAARIVSVASRVHRSGRLDLEQLTPARRFRWPRVYSRSKLANVMMTLALARRLEATTVAANCLHPGVVASNIVPADSPVLRWAGNLKLVKRFMRTTEQGAATSIYLALSPEVDGISGKYFNEHQQMIEPSPLACDVDAQERLWQKSLELTGIEQQFGQNPQS